MTDKRLSPETSTPELRLLMGIETSVVRVLRAARTIAEGMSEGWLAIELDGLRVDAERICARVRSRMLREAEPT